MASIWEFQRHKSCHRHPAFQYSMSDNVLQKCSAVILFLLNPSKDCGPVEDKQLHVLITMFKVQLNNLFQLAAHHAKFKSDQLSKRRVGEENRTLFCCLDATYVRVRLQMGNYWLYVTENVKKHTQLLWVAEAMQLSGRVLKEENNPEPLLAAW